MRILALLLLAASLCAQSDWSAYTGGLDFVVGWKAGMAEAKFTGRPAMLFFVKKNEDKCKVWAGTAFKDAACKKTLENFVLVLIDGEAEPEAKKKFPFKSYPFVKFVNPAGERLCEIWESADANVFEMAAGRGLGKHGQIRYTPAYAREVICSERMEAAVPLKEYREAIRSIAEIEKTNHEGKLLTRAREVKAELEAEGGKRLEAARPLLQSDPANAKLLYANIAREFEGLPLAAEALKIARSIKP